MILSYHFLNAILLPAIVLASVVRHWVVPGLVKDILSTEGDYLVLWAHRGYRRWPTIYLTWISLEALFKTFNFDAYKIYIYIYPVMDMTTVYRYDLQICALFWDPTRVKCNLSNILYIRSGNNTISQYSYLSLINFHCNFQSSIVTHACLQLQCL